MIKIVELSLKKEHLNELFGINNLNFKYNCLYNLNLNAEFKHIHYCDIKK